MTFEFSGTTPTIKSNGDILEVLSQFREVRARGGWRWRRAEVEIKDCVFSYAVAVILIICCFAGYALVDD